LQDRKSQKIEGSWFLGSLRFAILQSAISGFESYTRSPRRIADPDGLNEPSSKPPMSNQEQRLTDLERKLDRVPRSLDNIRGELGPFRAKGGLGP